MITFQVERWPDIQGVELEELLRLHYQQIALDQELVPLDIDYERYAALDATGNFHIVTIRDGIKLAGYYAAIISSHLHNKSTLFGFSDVYYVLQQYRKATTGIRLIQFMEQTLKERGVKKLVGNTKKHLDVGRIFEYLGWEEAETIYTKALV